MGFAIFTVFLLAIGSPFSGQAVSVDLQQPSPSVHHRTSRSTCVAGFEENNGNCYYFSSANSVIERSWQEASYACKVLGRVNDMIIELAELGNPDNLKSDGWLFQQINAKGVEVWLGAKDYTKRDDWSWTHSNRKLSIKDVYWGHTQPNNFGGLGQYCLATYSQGGHHARHYLDDELCTEANHYVCQIF